MGSWPDSPSVQRESGSETTQHRHPIYKGAWLDFSHVSLNQAILSGSNYLLESYSGFWILESHTRMCGVRPG